MRGARGVYIDDDVDACLEVTKTTDMLVILLDRAENRSPEVEEKIRLWPWIVRAHGWVEAVDLVRDRLAELRLEEVQGEPTDVP